MRMRIQCHGLRDQESVAAQMERRLYLALGRCLAQVKSVDVDIRRIDPPPRQRHECIVSVETAGNGRVRLRQVDSDASACAGRAAALVGRAVQRRITLPGWDAGRRSSESKPRSFSWNAS